MPRFARTLLVTAALGLTAGSAAAQDDLEWITGENPGEVTLMLGYPNSDHIKLRFDCHTDKDILTFSFLLESELGIAPPYTLTLANDAGDEVVLPARSVYLEMLDVHLLEVKTQLDEAMWALLVPDAWFSVTANAFPREDFVLPAEAVLQPLIDACIVVG